MHVKDSKPDSPLICGETSPTSLKDHENVVLSQGHNHTVPNGARNGRLHTLSGYNTGTNPSLVRACVDLVQLLIVSQNWKTKQKQNLVLRYEL